ncbi:MAG TPA: hypothetical protein VIX91_22895 [Candidatus Acidoferrum sp.]
MLFLCSVLFLLFFLTTPSVRAQSAPTNPPKEQSAAAPAVTAAPWTGDFDAMLQRRFIRTLVAHSKTQYCVINGVQHGSSYESMKAFEERVNLK